MKKVLIIGGSGSWGQELTKQLLARFPVEEIVIYSRGEHRQVEMARRFGEPRLRFVVGDVRDRDQLRRAAIGVSHVFHLAALKHVPVCERNPDETVKTNVLGTMNAVEVALEAGAERFVLVSTDKAVDPINVYGVSKSLAEKLVVNANLQSSHTVFVCIRGGNVLGTQGSVVPLFREQLVRANEITITDRAMTRYLMRLEEAIGLIFAAAASAKGGEVFVMKMPSARVIDIAEVMISHFGNSKTRIRDIGIRPGEKLHEALLSRHEGGRAFELENYFVILPTLDVGGVYGKWGRTSFLNDEYTSLNNRFLAASELAEILHQDGWLSSVAVSELERYSREELLEFFKKEGWSR